MSEKKLKELLTESSYTIEALENEVEDLEEQLRENHEKLWTIIQENDRLTMTYEPYRPPGDEHEGVQFYDLIDENNELRETVSRLSATIWELRAEVGQYKREKELKEVRKSRIKNDRYWNLTFELWPGAWGLNYYRYNWRKYNAESREGSIQLGPIGFSWNREPKR